MLSCPVSQVKGCVKEADGLPYSRVSYSWGSVDLTERSMLLRMLDDLL